jgi:rhodanese-related sulfurtransferase/mannose-6-phosphate isomerase-like protein (cupin superfamily)
LESLYMQLNTEINPIYLAGSTMSAEDRQAAADLRTPVELADIVSAFASSSGWIERVRLRTAERWYERVYEGADYDIWAISWLPGQSTGFHDHGGSAGAFVVATGVLEEHRPGERPIAIAPGEPRAFGRDYAHDVRNVSLAPAVSIHAYSPPLTDMNEYELDGTRLVPCERSPERLVKNGGSSGGQPAVSANPNRALNIDQVLAAARTRLQRLTPDEAYQAVTQAGAVLVDIRPESQRVLEGTISGALVIERNVLEWRFDPASSARLPFVNGHDLSVIVFCSEGYTSSLAAAALQDLGLWRATDIVGGFKAWSAAGLTIAPPTKVSLHG